MEPITAVFTALSEFFKTLTLHKDKQLETDVIKTKKSKSKAVEYAEKIIFYIESKYDLSKDTKYQRLRKVFFKYN